ncbi:hypothetical protein I0C86_32760 [Plantactinospora sp. S1510]|uniref:Uncharacterized protein n=1 Tax=Plantactinospora alkalitolerans TaxID=2789879 RepID=A0ABS0H5D1_9ACTN|nr:hypothetical protein [Plantactinospora alkalitolerans]MBF9133671.1 hypothetical protein [Plantactinospora alkalitolerans]
MATLPATVQYSVTVGLYHCGVDPLVLDGRTWEVPKPPFDATNKPDTWTGRGTAIEVPPENLTYTDESGTVLHFLPDDGIPPPVCA